MRRHTSWTLALGLAATLAIAPLRAFPPGGEDSEAKLTANLKSESNPVKKAQIEIRLSRLKLRAAIEANDRGETEKAMETLRAYHQHVVNAWDLLRNSGRVAHKKSQGFKELDIALREDRRFLEDMKRSLPLDDREPVDKIITDVERIRAEDLNALFPAMDGEKR
jgi:hypothetical protein